MFVPPAGRGARGGGAVNVCRRGDNGYPHVRKAVPVGSKEPRPGGSTMRGFPAPGDGLLRRKRRPDVRNVVGYCVNVALVRGTACAENSCVLLV